MPWFIWEGGGPRGRATAAGDRRLRRKTIPPLQVRLDAAIAPSAPSWMDTSALSSISGSREGQFSKWQCSATGLVSDIRTEKDLKYFMMSRCLGLKYG